MARGCCMLASGARRGPYRSKDDPTAYGLAGIKVRQWRLYRKMTVAVLAERARLAPGMISNIEAGKVGFGPDTLVRLAAALDTTVAGLFGVDPLRHVEFWSIWDQADDA